MPTQKAENLLTFAVIGAGYWARYQMAAWGEVSNVRCVAVVDPDIGRANRLADRFQIENRYSSIEAMLASQQPNFVDIVTTIETHADLALIAAANGTHVICQKPLAETMERADTMRRACDEAGVTLSVHENWRWQTPIRKLKALLDRQAIGKVFRATINYNNSFPVFANQPNLKDLDHFILSDMGTHIFDVARFLFGEPNQLFCMTHRTRTDIRGEDVASTMMQGPNGLSVLCNMSYASRLEHDRFPETRILIEGADGSIELSDDFWISLTTADGTIRQRHPPVHYEWADFQLSLVHSSMVDCHRHLADSIRSGVESETSGRDNLKTLAIVEAAYRSAASCTVVPLSLT